MPRRRELRGIAAGLLGSFTSRNNDIGGYWAIGQLYRFAQRSRMRKIDFDLLTGNINVRESLRDRLDALVSNYCLRLVDDCWRLDIPSNWIRSAHIFIEFDADNDFQFHREYPDENPFKCTVELEDDRGRRHCVQASGKCWPHNRKREVE